MIIAVEDIKMFNRKVLALKNDELEFIKKHCEEFSVYRNKRTQELFITRIDRVKESDEIGILLFVEKERKTSSHKRKNTVSSIDKNQSSLF